MLQAIIILSFQESSQKTHSFLKKNPVGKRFLFKIGGWSGPSTIRSLVMETNQTRIIFQWKSNPGKTVLYSQWVVRFIFFDQKFVSFLHRADSVYLNSPSVLIKVNLFLSCVLFHTSPPVEEKENVTKLLMGVKLWLPKWEKKKRKVLRDYQVGTYLASINYQLDMDIYLTMKKSSHHTEKQFACRFWVEFIQRLYDLTELTFGTWESRCSK